MSTRSPTLASGGTDDTRHRFLHISILLVPWARVLPLSLHTAEANADPSLGRIYRHVFSDYKSFKTFQADIRERYSLRHSALAS